MKKIYSLLLLACLSVVAKAQTAASYGFSQSSGTYTAISGTDVFGSFWDDGTTAAGGIPIGFTFKYLGTNYTAIGACANGWINFGSTAPSNSYTPLMDGTLRIAGFANDLWNISSASPNNISYLTTGTAPNRVFTIQWANFCHYSTTGSGPLNFQIKLYESSNVIEVVYGSMTPTTTASATWKTQMQVGINGTSTSDFNLRSTTTNWSSTTAGTSYSDYCSQTVSLVPASGLTFTWTPPPSIDVTPSSLTFVEAVSVTSAAQNVTVQACGLTSTSVTVTAPANYEVYDGTSWVTTMSIPVSSAAVGTYVNTVVPCHFVAPSTPSTSTGNLTFASTGATTANVALTGYSTVPCSGTPSSGTASASPLMGNPTTPITLSLSGYTVAGGISIQWQSSPDNVTWTNISGATLSVYTFTGLSASTYYRAEVTCSGSSTTTASASVFVTYMPAPSCFPTSSSWVSEVGNINYSVNTFDVTGFSGSTLSDAGMVSAANSTTGYIDRTSMTPLTLQQGGVYAANITWGWVSNHEIGQVWIDFDNDGTFATTEEVSPVFGWDPVTPPNPCYFNITIPVGAATGPHLMRIRGIWEYNWTDLGYAPAHVDPCLIEYGGSYPQYYSGDVADYYVNIVPLPPCSGTPSGITVNASQTFGCTTYSSTVSLAGVSAAGLTYQWQSSPDSLTWTSVSGATNTSYAASVSSSVYYRCVVTCPSSSSSMNTPGKQLVFSATAAIPYNESFEGITSSNTLPPCMDATNLGYLTQTYMSATGYSNMAARTGSKYGGFRYGCDDWFFTPGFALTAGSTYVFSFWYVTDGYSGWNTLQAMFGSSQTAFGMTSAIGTPVTSPTNTTYAQYTGTFTATSTGTFYIGINCSASYYPNFLTIDDINLTQLPACSGTVSGISPTATQTFGCTTYSSTVGLSGISSSGLTYQWESSPDSLTWTTVSGATNATYAASVPTSVYYRCNVTCSASSSTFTTAGIHLVFSATASIPYFESFEGIPSNNTLPPCMDATNLGYMTMTYTNATGYNNMAGHTGTKYAGFRYGCNDWFFTPGFAVTAGNTYVFSYWYVTDGYSGWNTLQAMYGSSQASWDMTTAIGTPVLSPSNTTYAQYTGTFTATSTGTIYIGINCDATYYPSNLTIDDINLVQLPGCTGTVSGISPTATQAYGCTTYSSTVGLSGVSASGLTYQWESSPDSLTWTTLSGATNSTYSASVSTSIYYRCIVTCAASSSSMTTAGIHLVYSATAALPYTESFESIPGNDILPICMDATNLGYLTQTFTSATGYANMAAHTGSKYASFRYGCDDWFFTPGFALTAGNTYTFSFWYVTDGYSGWNSLKAMFGTSQSSSGMTMNIGTPVTSPTNTTYAQYTGTFTATSTGTFYVGINCQSSYYPYYLTIDDINVTQLPNCTGTPSGLSVASTQTYGCSPYSPTLSLSGVGFSGYTYQWESSPDSTTWTSVSGATDASYSPAVSSDVYYRAIVTCPAGGSSLTTAGLKHVFTATVPLPYSESFEGITANNTLPPCMDATNLGYLTNTYTNATGYNNMYAHTGSKYAGFIYNCDDWFFTPGFSLVAGNSYVFSFWYITDGYYGWNTLQASFGTSQTPGGMTTTIGTPIAAPTNTSYAQYIGTFTATSTGTFYVGINCAASFWPSNLTIDDINVVQLPPCSGTPTAGTVNSSVSYGCGTVTPTLSLTGTTTGVSGLSYQWQSSPDNATWSNVSGATTMTYSPAVSANTYYRSEVSCGTLNDQSTSTMVSVNPVPAAIDGGYFVCLGGTTSLSSTTAGGTWSSSNTSTVSVDAAGVASGVASGTAAISYTLSTGCAAVTMMNVNTVTPTASASSSVPAICSGGSVSFTAAPTSTLPTYDMATIPYSFTTPSSPTTITSFTSMDDGYAAITLPFDFNFYGSTYSTAYIGTNGYISFGYGTGSNYTYSLPTSSMPPLIAYTMNDVLITSMGSVTYSTEGTAPNRVFVVTYNKLSTWGNTNDDYDAQIKLYETTNTIDVLVSNATWDYHTMGIQDGSSQALTPAGRNYSYYGISPSAPEAYRFFAPQDTYVWSPATYLASTTGTTVTASGLTGGTSSTYTVTRSYNGCGSNATATVTLNPLPAAITGTTNVCEGGTTALSTASTGGTWQSSSTTNATVDPVSGVVTGVVAGTSEISYTFTSTGCSISQPVIVNPLPANITGTASVCSGSTTTLTDITPLGTWGSGTPSVASVNAAGEVTGGTAGVAMITYTLPTGCIKTREATVNPLPSINVTPASVPTICEGESTSFSASSPTMEFSLLNQDFNSGLGLWTINTPTDPGDGISPWVLTTSPISGPGDGTALVEANPAYGSGATVTETILTSPSFSTIGFGSADLTFNQNLSSTSSADMNVELQYSIDGGATWSLLLDQMNAISGSGVWSASSPEISLPLPSAALNVPDVKIRWYYKSNFGLWWQVDNIAVKAALPAATFTWTGVGGATGLSCTGCASPTITPTAPGANVYNVTASSTCSSNTNVTINVNPLPGVIGGTSATLCVGNSITLSNPDAGGTWTSSDLAVATIDPVTGEVTGVAMGTTLISYTLPSTCSRIVTLTVDAAPAPITGTLQVCTGLTTSLSHPVIGGVWSSSTADATIDAATGVATGVTAGSSMITYVLPTGCRTSGEVTVNSSPAVVTGTPEVCEGLTTLFSCATAGGSWSSDNVTIATVATTGDVTGVVPGTASIVYTMPNTCTSSMIVSVNGNPADILGTLDVCEASTTSLSSSTPAGTWTSGTTTVATIDPATGVLTGVTAGVASITYTLATGCLLSTDATVNALPAPVTGSLGVCIGLSTSLSSATPGGSWNVGTISPATVGSSGVVTGVSAGTTEITYTLPTGCSQVATVTVNSLPSVFSVTGGGSYCAGGTGVPVGMASSQTGTSYQLYMGATPIGSPVTGSGSTITFGPQTAGTYTVIATNSTSCVADMTGSAVITATPISLPSVTLASTPVSPVCAGTAVTYTATPVNGGTLPVYDWEVNSVPVSGVTSTTYSYVPVSGDVVKVTLHSNAVCAVPSTAVYTISTTVNPNETPVATVAYVGATSVCEGNSITLNVTPAFGGSTPAYMWYVNGTSTGFTGTTYSYVPTAGDVVTCELTSSFACVTTPTVTSTPMTMAVTTVYVPSVGITVAPGTVITAGTSVTFTAVVTGTPGPSPTYQWYKNGFVIPTATTNTYTSSTLADDDSISCKVVGTAPCGEESFNSVIMQVKTAVQQLPGRISNVRLVPNPNNGEFVLTGSLATGSDDQVVVEVTNMLGQTVYTGKFIAKGGNINEKMQLSHTLANGMYMLNVHTGSEVEVIHFVLEQ